MREITRVGEQEEATIKVKGWSKPPKLKDLKQDLADAKSAHDRQKNKIRGWLDNLHITGSAKINAPKGSSQVQPKLIRKQAEWRYAALSEPFLAAESLFNIEPVTWEDVAAANQNALVLNHQINTKINKTQFIDNFVRAGVDEGTIIVKVGWETEERTERKRVPKVTFLVDEQMAPLYQELDAMERDNPTEYLYQIPEDLKIAHSYVKETGVPVRPRVMGWEFKEVPKVIRNAPCLEVCDYRNVVIDPSCRGDASKAKFFIYSFETSLTDLKKDGNRYQNLDRISLDANSPLGAPDHETNDNTDFNFSDNARKRLVAFEYWGYWDTDGSGVVRPIVATWVGDTLIRLEESPFPDGKLPFVVIPLLPVRNSVYGEPDGELLADNQRIIGAVTRGMIDIMGRSANGQMAIRKDALDAVNRRRFDQGKDYEFNAGMDPKMAFHMHTYPEIPQSAQYMLEMQNMDAESMTGVKAFHGGISSGALGEVATGIRGVLDAASKRETGILRRLACGMAEIGRKIIAMNSEFLEDQEIIRVTNDNFVAVRRDALAGDFDLKVDVSSLEEDNIKAQELAFMLQTMGPNGDPRIAMIILAKIARLRKMPDLAHEFENYEPQADPVQQQIQMQELINLQLEAQEKEAKIRKLYADSGLSEARAQEAIATARLRASEADVTDLDFVEQESGVKQERDLQKSGEQARANMALEGVKHMYNLRERRQEHLQKYLNGGRE